MTNKTKEEMQNIYAQRKIKLSDYLQKENLGCCVFIDNEEHRDPALNYFSGHSSDAILLIFSDGYSILIPWDENLAKQNATFDKLIPFTRYKCKDIEATKAALNLGGSHKCSDKVELPTALTYPEYLRFVDSLNMYQCRCTEHGAHEYVKELRMIKDEYEIECTKEAARIGDLIIDKIEEGIKNNSIQTEMDVALLIERECRIHGCQRTGFDTLAAGPSRSFAIHAFPGYTSAKWPDVGLSILDFGVVYNGYTSDTTVTVAKGELSEEQEKQLELVQTAYDECLKLYTKEHTIVEAAKKADSVFAKAKMKMPHSLGHAIGLEIHEAPRVSTKTDNSLKFQPGMILTLEPGLYDAKNGGCRLENDILITEDGNQVISNSRIIRIK
ncbi:MAG: aminopeptidase P family protein [Treponema sp.]|nr:aminopeptidase P family protein [Treponema sp.]